MKLVKIIWPACIFQIFVSEYIMIYSNFRELKAHQSYDYKIGDGRCASQFTIKLLEQNTKFLTASAILFYRLRHTLTARSFYKHKIYTTLRLPRLLINLNLPFEDLFYKIITSFDTNHGHSKKSRNS